MKKLILFLSVLFLFSGCYTTYHLTDQMTEYNDIVLQEPQFTKIPIKATQEKIDVIFPGEKIPDEPYIKVDILETTGSANTSMKSLIEDLQYKGNLRGVDALVIMSNNNFTQEQGDYVYNIQKVSALGIKYVKNINYLDECIKQMKIIALDQKSGKYETKATIKTNWSGDLMEHIEGEMKYWNFFYNYSRQHLIDETNNWSFQRTVGSGGMTKLKRVLRNNAGVTAKIVTANFLGNKLVSLKVGSGGSSRSGIKVIFNYDKYDYLISKEIESVFGTENFRQEFFYSEDGRPLRVDVYKIPKAGGEKEFYFKAIFETFEQEELKEMLAAETINQ